MLDELSISHEHRIAWINNCVSTKDLADLIRITLIDRGYDVAQLSKLHQLALVSNMDPTDYARQHSMLAVLRVAAKHGADMPHGADNAQAFSRRLGMLPQRSGVYCCIKCIEEDVQKFSFSWYRRKHHLVGVDWCLEHTCTLSRIEAPFPFIQPPHIWASEDKLMSVEACSSNLPEGGFLHRYVEIATKLLERDRPFQVEHVKHCLVQRARHYDLRIGRYGQRNLISDRLFELAPNDWLKQHLPACDTKIPLVYFQRIDSLALIKRCAGVGDAYVMAIAVLYESAEEAMLDLSSINGAESFKPDSNKPNRRGNQFWDGDIWPHYLAAKGVHSEVAINLGIERGHLGGRLISLGLPSLLDFDKSNVWRAFERFGRGESLSKSCELEQVEPFELEKLLRKSSARVLKAINTIRLQPSNQSSEKNTRKTVTHKKVRSRNENC